MTNDHLDNKQTNLRPISKSSERGLNTQSFWRIHSNSSTASKHKYLNYSEKWFLNRDRKIIFSILFFLIAVASSVYLFGDVLTSTKGQIIYLKATSPDFIGREGYLSSLYNDLLKGKRTSFFKGGSRVKVLWGKGGYGKSELAIKFANEHLKKFSLVWTIYCDSEQQIEQGYRDLAEKLDILNSLDSFSKVKENVHLYLENHHTKRPWLLIFDNVEQDILEYPNRGGIVLCTSQKKNFNPEFLLEVHPFTKNESLSLFERIIGKEGGEESKNLAEDLENIPLLIGYAAHYIKATPGCSLGEYRSFFSSNVAKEDGFLWKKSNVNEKYCKSLASSWQFPLRSLASENPLALRWLYLCSYLAPDNIREDWIGDWLSCIQGSTVPDRIQGKEVLQVLQKYGLIRYDKEAKSFSIHRFLQYIIRESRKQFIEEDLGEALAFLNKHSSDYSFVDTVSWDIGKNWYSHAYVLWKQIGHLDISEFSHEFKQYLSRLYAGIGGFCIFRNMYKTGLEIAQDELDLRKSLAQIETTEIATIYNNIGWFNYLIGRYSASLESHEKALQIYAKNATKDLTYANILNDYGLALFAVGEYQKALDVHNEVIQIYSSSGHERHIRVSWNLHNMGRSYHQFGRLDKAMECYKIAAELERETYGSDHPYANISVTAIGRVLADQGKYEIAISSIKKALERCDTSEARSIGSVSSSYNVLGWCYMQMGEYKEARKNIKKALKFGIAQNVEDFFVLSSYRTLGWCYLKDKQIQKALLNFEKYLQQGFVTYEKFPKKMEEIIDDFYHALKELCLFIDNWDDIQKVIALVRRISVQSLGESHPITKLFLDQNLIFNSSQQESKPIRLGPF